MTIRHKDSGKFKLPPGDDQPVYLRFRKCILDLIASGKLLEGEMLPSMNQFSRMLGISATPYHKAIDELIRDGYLKGRHGKGVFIHSTAPRPSPARIVTLLTSEPEILEHLAFTQVINGLLDELVPANYSLKFTFFSRDANAEEIRQKLDELHSEGIVIPFCSSNTPEQFLPLRQTGTPLVFLGRGFREIPGCAVKTDTSQAIRECLAPFAGKKLSIAYIGQPVEMFANRILQWLKAASREHRIKLTITARIPCAFDQKAGQYAMEQFLDSGKTADLVIAEDDYVACGAMSVMEQRRVKLPITIIGGFLKHLYPLNNHPVLDLGHRRMGQTAAKALLQSIAGEKVSREVTVHSDYWQ